MLNEYGLHGSFTGEDITSPAKLHTGRMALIDADYAKYIVTSKIYKDVQKIERGELDIFLKEDPVVKYTKQWLADFLTRIEDPMIFCFSAPSVNTFRCHISFDKKYKGNRKKDSYDYEGKSQDMHNVMRYIVDNYLSLITDDLEADDIVAMLQDMDNTYIISKDKDLKQVPGWHYNFNTNEIELISHDTALFNLSKQLLMGDTTDHISGLPGVGEVNAQKILREVENPRNYVRRVLHEYQKRFGVFKGTDMFTETWMLVKMRENRGNDFLVKNQKSFDTKTMVLNQLKKEQMK